MKLTLQLKWVTQAQFAGYYVAQGQGLYEAEDLDVTIKPGGPDIAPPQVIAGGGADVIVDWMPSALASAREGCAAGQHRPAVQALGHDADLPQGNRHHLAGRLPRARRWASGSSATSIRSCPG
jgi:ABC-type nitrate/sulfonate/bicarbonate transport system substrate-binding protein